MSIKIENTHVFGWEEAIRGARNPMNSWEKSDSWFLDPGGEYGYPDARSLTVPIACAYCIGKKDKNSDIYVYEISWYTKEQEWDPEINDTRTVDVKHTVQIDWKRNKDSGGFRDTAIIGPADHKLLMNLCKGGTEEAKWRRMVHVQMDVTAPLYWWKEFETYKVGTVSNSCSTMHKIQAKEFTLEDFSCEHLISEFEYPDDVTDEEQWQKFLDDYCAYDCCEEHSAIDGLICEWDAGQVLPMYMLEWTIAMLNRARYLFLETKDKKYWWQMIQLLPSSYNQKRTIDLNYEVLAAQYRQRKDHKLDDWHQYCDWIRGLPYSEFITMEET